MRENVNSENVVSMNSIEIRIMQKCRIRFRKVYSRIYCIYEEIRDQILLLVLEKQILVGLVVNVCTRNSLEKMQAFVCVEIP